jgi:hypothetical protein
MATPESADEALSIRGRAFPRRRESSIGYASVHASENTVVDRADLYVHDASS